MKDIPDFIQIDKSLLYVIQKITGDSTLKIVNYFCSLGKSMIEDGVRLNQKKKKKTSYVSKTMKWTYEDTFIPFALSVFYSNSYGDRLTMSVKFSSRLIRVDNKEITKMMDQDADYVLGLEGAQPVGDIAEPLKRAPVAIKKQLKKDLESKNVGINIADLPQELVKKLNLY
jgi:hypothetical protein